MADYGGYFRAEDGTLAVTSDTPCYEFYREHSAISRIYNVNTYLVDSQAFPLIAVACGVDGEAGVLSIEGGPGNWTVTVLTNKICTLLSFVPITGNTSTGYGIATYDATGRLVFDSFRKILNARAINNLSENVSFPAANGIDVVAYTSGPVKPSKTVSEQWVDVETYAYVDLQYSCSYSTQYNCYQEDVYGCTSSYVCTPSFSCGMDMFGGFSCGYVDSCGYQTTCGYTSQQVCRTEVVQTCGWSNILNYASISALVRTTNWTIERGTARLNSTGVVSFNWLLHKSGYYKELIDYQTLNYSFALSGNLIPGYIAPIGFLTSSEAYEGELSKNNTFPYTTGRANVGALTCITAVRSDYD